MSSANRGHVADHTLRKRRWRTSPRLIASLRAEVRGFALDAAAEPGAAVCPVWLGPGGVAEDCLRVRWRDFTFGGSGVVWFNPPWGSRLVPDDGPPIPGTADFVAAAVRNARQGPVVLMLVPTAPDTEWWRSAYRAADEVRLLPRVRFVDPDTGEVGDSPPGGGVTLFRLTPWATTQPRTLIADHLGRPL